MILSRLGWGKSCLQEPGCVCIILEMRLTCLDVEGVLLPEIWQSVAARTGVAELQLTTRDIPDYHRLMRHRLAVLDERGMTLHDIQETIAELEPLPGARDFIGRLRGTMQFILMSDTFEEFAAPLMKQLDYPTLFCNSLSIEQETGRIVDYHLRQENGKLHAVRAFKRIGFEVFAAGDSYNDLAMIQAADQGALYNPPDSIAAEHPDLLVCLNYQDLYSFLAS